MGTEAKILFVLKHPGYIWQYGFAGVIAGLLKAGCDVTIGFTNTSKTDWLHSADVARMFASTGGASVVVREAPVRKNGAHTNALRALPDYRRYAAPLFMGANLLKWRAKSFTPARWLGFGHERPADGAGERFWTRLAATLPTDGDIKAFLREEKPDVVVLSQLVEFVSNQRDYVDACEALGIPSVYMVASWDNLTNKGGIGARPTRILVWNETQKQEAVALHGVPESKVVVTGAVPFEDLREFRVSVDRETQLRSLGLKPDDEYIVFLGSSNFISEFSEETSYFQSFAAAIAKHPDPRIAEKVVVIRPHPQSATAWAQIDLAKIGRNCVLSQNEPQDEAEAHDPAANRQAFYDLLAHAYAAFGSNTTAMIEAAIVGTPVISVDTLRGQRETIHFSYLRHGVIVAREPSRVLDALLALPDGPVPDRLREFPERFAFPKGPAKPSDLATSAILETASAGSRRPGRVAACLSNAVRRILLSVPEAMLRRDWQDVLDTRLRVKYEQGAQVGFQRQIRSGVRIAFGLTAYNNAKYLRAAIDSILQQSFSNLMLVCLDDCSSDETAQILQEYEKRDPRIRVFRNAERLGMVRSWKRVFELATTIAPDAGFFAWASDHDVWHPYWLERMLVSIGVSDDIALVYPLTEMIDADGRVIKKPKEPIRFDTANTTTVADRVIHTAERITGAGNMVYGLFRVDALRRAGIFRDVLLPDRLLMLDMVSQGHLVQVDELLWSRRVIGKPSLARQHVTLFTDDNKPRYLSAPWSIQHAVGFALQQFRTLRQAAGLSRLDVLRLALVVYRTQRRVERAKTSNGDKATTGKLKGLGRSLWPTAAIGRMSTAFRRHGVVRAIVATGHGMADWGACLAAMAGDLFRKGRGQPSEVLFVGRRYMHFAYYQSVFDLALRRRVPLRILFDQMWCAKDPEVARRKFEGFLQRNPRARFGWARRRADGPLRDILFSVRELRAYLNYEARKGVSGYYVERWWALLTTPMKARFEKRWFAWLARTAIFRNALSVLEAIVPPDPAIVRELSRTRPRMVFVSPLIQRFSEEIEYVKAAKLLGIPTAALVLSWDTLSTKGLIQVKPDRLLVWNEHHREQARRIHAVPDSRIHLVGAPFFDKWFERSRPVDVAFIRAKWHIPTPRYILYLGSSSNIARDESWFVHSLAELLAADPVLRDVTLVVRPHPANSAVYAKLSDPNVVVTKTDGSLPDTPKDHDEFAALLKSAVCCVGINTSAMLDAVFAGAPTATVLLDQYAGTQKQAEHFNILVAADCLKVFEQADEFIDWVRGAGASDGRQAEAYDRFARAFARPGGLDVSAAELTLRALGVGSTDSPPAGERDADAISSAFRRRSEGMAETRSGASLLAHIQDRQASEVFDNYLLARNAVLRMMDDEELKLPAVSDYWREELDGFRYMLDASPLIVDRLREHCYHITGIKSYDYREHHAHKAAPYLRKLEQLRAVDPGDLFVGESPAMGGFGYRAADGSIINIDTLKFYEVMIGLHRSGFVDRLGLRREDGAGRSAGQRIGAVMEIGSGWGGFAYHFKKLYPGVPYLCLDLPQTMIFSLTYLRNVFPDGKFLVVDSDEARDALARYWEYDFIFVPHQRIDDLSSIKIGGCINMVSFQEMKTENVTDYARFLSKNKCENLYSLNRDRSAHNENLTSVSEILGEYYNLQECDVLTLPYTNFGNLPERGKEKGIHDYRHQFGVRKR